MNHAALDHLDNLCMSAQRASALLNAVSDCKGEANFWHMNHELQDAYFGVIEHLIEEIQAQGCALYELAKQSGGAV